MQIIDDITMIDMLRVLSLLLSDWFSLFPPKFAVLLVGKSTPVAVVDVDALLLNVKGAFVVVEGLLLVVDVEIFVDGAIVDLGGSVVTGIPPTIMIQQL